MALKNEWFVTGLECLIDLVMMGILAGLLLPGVGFMLLLHLYVVVAVAGRLKQALWVGHWAAQPRSLSRILVDQTAQAWWLDENKKL